jgi:single-strand DNA-binding protein
MSSNEPSLVLRGRVATTLTYRPEREGRNAFCSFRLAVTPSRRDVDGAWADQPTQWYTVKVWKAMADNAAGSLRKGDPVVVAGRLSAEEWVSGDGTPMSGLTITADTLGHDLRFGRTHFTRPPGPQDERADTVRVDVTGLREIAPASPDEASDEPGYAVPLAS